jgi:hypothetical protein
MLLVAVEVFITEVQRVLVGPVAVELAVQQVVITMV